eukprot:TRINITY_DN2042_c0_g2_i2.p1 TRINITY_DN2042_c0_g2~~TRINITY_DN2042_c0_g2_i2.p1  ORF type:complete len:439 (-),score=77.18 TRINITY_DN2042_c0_g2_i2:55-1371(-)
MLAEPAQTGRSTNQKTNEFQFNRLEENMKLYYTYVFPAELIKRWLSPEDNGKDVNSTFKRREICLTLFENETYVRYQCYDNAKKFKQAMMRSFPQKIDIGAIYKYDGPQTVNNEAIEKELVFDIDMDAYDKLRTCCEGKTVCNKCWKFVVVGAQIIDATLREDFGFKHIIWVFSGRRGIHCWVSDKRAKKMSFEVRASLSEYINIFSGNEMTDNLLKQNVRSMTHPLIKRARDIINQSFSEILWVDQKLFVKKPELLLKLLEADNNRVGSGLRDFADSILRKYVGKPDSKLQNDMNYQEDCRVLFDEIQRRNEKLLSEIYLYLLYPKIDINVSKSVNHLLKGPFCVHHATQNICVPLRLMDVLTFNPDKAPKVADILAEMTRIIADPCIDPVENGTILIEKKSILDYYSFSSLAPYISIFLDHIAAVERSYAALTSTR